MELFLAKLHWYRIKNVCYPLGYRKIWHSGGIVSYQNQLWLFPDQKAGVFVVISGPLSSQGSLAMKVSSCFLLILCTQMNLSYKLIQ